MAKKSPSRYPPILRRYPWDSWFNTTKFKPTNGILKRFTLTRGKDFDCLPHGMVNQIRSAAKKRGVRVSVKVSETTIKVAIKE